MRRRRGGVVTQPGAGQHHRHQLADLPAQPGLTPTAGTEPTHTTAAAGPAGGEGEHTRAGPGDRAGRGQTRTAVRPGRRHLHGAVAADGRELPDTVGAGATGGAAVVAGSVAGALACVDRPGAVLDIRAAHPVTPRTLLPARPPRATRVTEVLA
ncbi:MAG: hypothetical protein ACT4RN_23360 [Pseudonocardia sp.]